MSELKYAGFWVRVGASLIDTILVLIVVAPVLTLIYGGQYWGSTVLFMGYWGVLLNYVFPAFVVVLFWIYRSATPGKMILKLKIVDAKTNGPVPTARLIVRYIGYYISVLPLLLGLIWVGFDQKKQGWHDKLAGTVVIKDVPENT